MQPKFLALIFMDAKHSLEPVLWAALLGFLLLVTVALWTTGVPFEGSALSSLVIAVVGWKVCVPRSHPPSPMQNRLKPVFIGIAAALAIVVAPGCIRELRSGNPLESLWKLGARVFGKEPPLDIRRSTRTDQSGQKVEYLVITNKSGDGVAPVHAKLTRGESTVEIGLPPVIKPYETVEVRLHDRGSSLLIEQGDVLQIECEGYSNAWHGRWNHPPSP